MKYLSLLAVLFCTTNLFTQTPPVLKLQGWETTLPQQFDARIALADQIPPAPKGSAQHWAWLQFHRALTMEEVRYLEQLQIQLLGYIADHCYYVSIPKTIQGNPLSSLPVYSLSAFQPDHILHRSLRSLRDITTPSTNKLNLLVGFHTGLVDELAQVSLLESGFHLGAQKVQQGWIRMTIPQHQLGLLASLRSIRFIENAPAPGEPEDRNGRAMHRSHLIQQAGGNGLAFDGSGVSLLVRDDGKIGPHIDFHGRLNQHYCIRAASHGTHGDMVSGIATGSGNLNPSVQGMAPGAMLFTEDYDGDFPDYTMNIIQQEDIEITNSSYSDGCNEGYTMRTERVDQQIYARPTLMHVFSAGNAGNSDCDYGAGSFWGNITGGHKMGKNAIATANLASNLNLESSSSRGPAYDGRIKPDLSAHGANQLSTYPFHTIGNGGGTSAAAPGVAGVLAQLTQAYREIYAQQEVPSALLKAILMNTATDMGQPGPDFRYGWGHLHALNAYKVLENTQFQRLTSAPGETQTFTIDIPADQAEVRFMIYWPDRAAMPQSAISLINDLDLRVQAPGAPDFQLPLVLDHTPDASLLNQPAQPGVDHLNNMEQVRFYNPDGGTYTIEVHGHAIPFGEVEAWLVYAFRDKEPHFVFPAGGESFLPGEAIQFYWEAELDTMEWTLSFSEDGGQSWTDLANNIPAGARHHFGSVPMVNTDSAYFRLTSDVISITQDAPIHIFPSPENIRVTKACPDSITFAWDSVANILHYDVFQLGERYMEWVGQTDSTFITLASWNPLADNWVSVQSVGPDSVRSPRTRAFNHRAGLVACAQEIDVRMASIIAPIELSITACEPAPLEFTLSIRNDGLQPAINVPISYQVGDADPVHETLNGTINPGGVRFYKFLTPPLFTETGEIPIVFWTSLLGDQFRYNDSLYAVVNAAIQITGSLVPEVTEDFEAGIDLPADWTLFASNEDEITWRVVRIEMDGDSTNALVMPNFFYDQIGEKDILMSPQIDLTNAGQPRLGFDLAYSGFLATGPDTLIIEIAADCKEDNLQIVYVKSGNDLITISDPFSQVDYFVPSTAEDWRYEEIDLSPFAGSKILVRFVNVAGYGNNLWIDNIRLLDPAPQGVLAGFDIGGDYGCIGGEIQFSDISSGNPSQWMWAFGQDAQPSDASTSGPHLVTYSSPGWKEITLVVTRDAFSDTIKRMVEIKDLPQADFSAFIQGDTLFLTNLSLNGTTFRWRTDLHQEIQEEQPYFILEQPFPEALNVTLIVENMCGADTLESLLKISSLQEPSNVDRYQIHPNPVSDILYLQGEGMGMALHWEMMDTQGRLLGFNQEVAMNGPRNIAIPITAMTPGTYFLRVEEGGFYKVFTFQVK